ncbi:MAG: hypothetical protein HFE86_08225 [Clostridiales bacterium]|nr:hypothetical protein [Clostridiales bacterium]
MLGKLLKHEFKASGRIVPIFYLIVIGLMILGTVCRLFKIYPIAAIIAFLLAMGCVAVMVGTLAIIAVRFYRSLFGREGYLTQTLPVSKGSLVLSRLLLALFWLLCGLLVCLAAVSFIFFLLDLGNPLERLRDMMDMMGAEFTGMVLFLLVSMVTQTLVILSAIYFAVTLSHTKPFLKNNILFSVVWYFALNTAVGLLELAGMLFIPILLTTQNGRLALHFQFMTSNLEAIGQTGQMISGGMGVGNILVDLTIAAALLPLTVFLLRRKTSVK